MIVKLRKDKFPYQLRLVDINEAEGPFDSLFELKKNSYILSSIKLQKHRQRVLKNSNIEEINDHIFHKPGFTYDESFSDAFDHTIVGKISNQKVNGVHFFNPEFIKIIEVISKDEKTGVYSARIAKLNINTGMWIAKDDITNFFPDHWSINQLFHECYYAFINKEQISDRIFKSKTITGIFVKFVINEEGKILTFYPEFSEE